MRVAGTYSEPNTCMFVDDVDGGFMAEMPCGKVVFVPHDFSRWRENIWPTNDPFYCPFTGVEVFIPKGAEW